MRTQTTRTIAGRVDLNGAILAGSGFTAQKGALGIFTVRLSGGVRLISAVANALQSGYGVTITASVTGDSFNVQMVNFSGASVDLPFSFTAVVHA